MFSTSYAIEKAREWVGTPYRHHGRAKGVACDCAGFVMGLAFELGEQDAYLTTDYGLVPREEKVFSACDQTFDLVPDGVQPVAGMVAVLRILDGAGAQHLGIIGEYNGRLTLIHSFGKHDKVVEHTLSKFWRQRILRLYYIRQVDYGDR